MKTKWTVIGGAAALALSPVAAFGIASATDRGVAGAPLGDGIVVHAAAATVGPADATSAPTTDPSGTQTVSAPSPVTPLTAKTPVTPNTPATAVSPPVSPKTPVTPLSAATPISPASPRSAD